MTDADKDYATDWRTMKPGRIYSQPAGADYKLIRADEKDMVILVSGAEKAQTISADHMCEIHALKEVN